MAEVDGVEIRNAQDNIHCTIQDLKLQREHRTESSRCVALAITKLQEATHWLEQALKERQA